MTTKGRWSLMKSKWIYLYMTISISRSSERTKVAIEALSGIGVYFIPTVVIQNAELYFFKQHFK